MLRILSLFLVCLMMPSITLLAEWERLSYAPNYPVRDMVLMDDKIYLATSNGGIFLSSDRGDNWQAMNDGISLLTTSIVVFGRTLLAGTLDSGIFRSEDLGAHWKPSRDSLLEWNVIDLKVDGSDVYALTESSGIWISQDGGKTWIMLPIPESATQISSFEVKNGFIFAGTLDGSLYFSSNSGENWVDLRNSQLSGSVFFILYDNAELFVGTDFGLYYSSNMGVEWFNRSSGIRIPRVNFITKISEKLFIGTRGSGIFFSENNGEFWFDFNDALPDLNANVIINDNFYVYAGTEYGSVSRRRLSEITIPQVNPPKLSNPPNLIQNADTSIVFLWEEEKAAKGYHFVLAENESFSSESIVQEQKNLTKNSVSISELEPLTYYFWKVASIDLNNKEYWSETYRFRTRKSLTIPTLIAPTEGEDFTDFPIVFLWTSLDSAINYTLQLSGLVDFETIDYEFSIPDTVYSLNSADLRENTKYYWRVISKIRNMGNERTSTSKTRSFYFKKVQSVETPIAVDRRINIFQNENELVFSFPPIDYGKLNFNVCNILGSIVFKMSMDYSPTNTQFILNIENMQSGFYIVSLDFGSIRITQPLVIFK